MKRRNDNGSEVLDNILESVGLKNMIKDSDDDSDDDSDWEITNTRTTCFVIDY